MPCFPEGSGGRLLGMDAARKLLSEEQYLQAELASPVKHEYLGGVIYAMAGANNVHNLIATNTSTALGYRLRGSRCRPYNSDTKIRVRLPQQVRFYYPDVSVVCRSNPPGDSFQDEPVVLVEVLSSRTRRVDEGEKKDAYLTIPTLGVYILLEQGAPALVAYRRTTSGFIREEFNGLDAQLILPEIGIELPLAEVYDGVEFAPEGVDDEE